MAATQNPLKIVKTGRQPRRLADDMPRNNALLLGKDAITHISRAENKGSVMSFFGQMLGSTVSADRPGGDLEDLIKVEPQGMQAEFIRERVIRDVYVPALVTDASRVPTTLVAGKGGAAFVFRVNKYIGGVNSLFTLRDQRTRVIVAGLRNLANEEVEYTCQLNAPPGTTAPGYLLGFDAPVHYRGGNTMGEGSLGPNDMVEDGEIYTDTINALQIQRLGFVRTGSAKTDNTITLTTQTAMDGSEVTYNTDMPAKAARLALYELDRSLVDGVPNFDAANRIIANRLDGTRYAERPTFAGLHWQWDQAPFRFEHYLASSDQSAQRKIDQILSFSRERNGKKVKHIAICQGVGRAWLKKVFLRITRDSQYRINVDIKDGKFNAGSVGYDIDTYVTPDGEIMIFDISTAIQGWNMGDRTSYNGNSYSLRSKRIYISPVTVMGSNGKPQPIVKLMYKEKDDLSRLFSIAVSRGQTGQHGLTYAQLQSMSDESVKAMIANDQFRVDSWVDGDEIGFLSQVAPMCKTDQMMILDLK